MSQIIVTRRRTTRLSMRIAKNGDVHVSAPYQVADSEIRDFIDQHQDWILQAQQRTLQSLQTRDAFFAQLPLTTRQEWVSARQRLDAIVSPLLEHYATEMGVRPATVYYRATISRWGSCHTGRRAICFSLYLLLLPMQCIEHVVVHELAHLMVPNHGPRFYEIMDRYYPRWREARAEARRISRMTESCE